MTTTPNHISPLGVPGTALITGAASGIGLAITRLLARSGCSSIALCDLNGPALSAAATSLLPIATHPSFRAITITVDVSSEASVKAMVQEAVTELGRIDYAVNCAGIGLKKELLATETADWERMIAVNLTGVFLCVREEVKVMQAQEPLVLNDGPYAPVQRGSIVNIASLAAITGLRHSGAYTAAKHGVMGITRTAALDYPDVKINGIAPGYIATPLTDAPGEMRRNALEKVENWTPMRRFGRPEEIAEGVVWLLGWRSNFVHGSCLVIDGGYLAQ